MPVFPLNFFLNLLWRTLGINVASFYRPDASVGLSLGLETHGLGLGLGLELCGLVNTTKTTGH